MKNKKNGAFTRTCIACNCKKNKYELLRIVWTKENKMSIDRNGKAEGKGIYLCYDLECLNKAIKTKKLEKKIKQPISEKIYEDIRGVIIDKKEAKQKNKPKQNGGDV